MEDFDRVYTITLTKDLEKGQFVSKITQKGLRHGTVVETPMDAPDCIVAHVEELKEVLESKMVAYYNKHNK